MADPPGKPVNLTLALLLIGAIVAGVWIWKRLPPGTQDDIVDYGVPAAAVTVVVAGAIGLGIRAVRRRNSAGRRREQLMARFEREGSTDRRLELAFELIELNQYRPEGLDRIREAMAALFLTTLNTALGDKQHRIRGMAASHLGLLQDPAVIPALMAALDDDHAYVRACAALGLGRMRATVAKGKLEEMAKEDWDQTVRSRAREALERIA
jgi:hypothetical protein